MFHQGKACNFSWVKYSAGVRGCETPGLASYQRYSTVTATVAITRLSARM